MLRYLFLLGLPLVAQTNIDFVKVTNTQAILIYTAPSDAACTLDVRESGAAAVVHDVNSTLFSGSNLDSRSTSASIGRRRTVVIGKRAAELASDGKYYSRALQANTLHTFAITCTGGPANGSFRTANIALGNTFLEGIPADPANPTKGNAWPTLSWADRTQNLIDPQTGLLVKRVSLAADTYNMFGFNWTLIRGSGAWTNTANISADDSSAATYTDSVKDWLFLGHTINVNPSRNNAPDFIPQVQIEMNAYCSGGDCSTASATDRSIEICLTINGINCTGNTITQVLLNCPSSCTSGTYRFTVGDDGTNSAMLPAWTSTDPYTGKTIHPFDQYTYTGTVDRSTNAVTAVSGRFNVNWPTGSIININGTNRLISSVESDKALTLQFAPVGTETGVAFTATQFGVMVRKLSTSTTPITIQYARMIRGSGLSGGRNWDPTGQYDQYANCSDTTVTGVASEVGRHCQIGGIFYWIGDTTGTVIPIGRTFHGGRGGTDGWPSYVFCDGYWDKSDGNTYYCGAYGLNGDSILLKWVYTGTNTVAANISAEQASPVECGTSPCWTITNMTKQSLSQTVNQQVAAFDATFAAKMPLARFQLLSILGNTAPRFMFRAMTDSVTNDVMAYYVIMDGSTGLILASSDQWSTGVLRWSAVHGFDDSGDSSVMKLSPTFFRGPYSGTDPYRGDGPYVARITSGAISGTGSACPARPGGSPIPVGEWPTGNNCMTITVDGEPGDPTPAVYTTGTITTSGANVTGSGTNWPYYSNGYKMKISGSYYTFTWVSATTGTLSPTPPAVSGSAYTLFLETIGNAATGAGRFEDAYLMDAAAGDAFGVNSSPGCNAGNGSCGLFGQSEYMRLLIKTGNSWQVERGYNKSGVRSSFLTASSNAYVSMLSSSCSMVGTYACGAAYAYWDFSADPHGSGSGVTSPTGSQQSNGGGHGFTRPTHEISTGAQANCPTIDGNAFTCYNIRLGANLAATTTSTTNLLINETPPFAGKVGLGVPNVVESHPAPAGYLTAANNPGQPGWFLDARPMNGGTLSGSSGSPATLVGGTLWKFTSSQLTLSGIDRKKLPTVASCGLYPLVDISGPSVTIGTSSTDAYKYCYASQVNECRSGSAVGDAYLNCPMTSTPYCASADADARDLCIGGSAATTSGIVQTAYGQQDMSGARSRVLTKGFSNHRATDFFWNAKSNPTGRWSIFRTVWAHGFGHEVFLAKLPPFPQPDGINRSTFMPVAVTIGASRIAAETHAIVEFGYDTNFYCTSRQEACQKGNAADYAFAYEAVAPVSCASGCEIKIPAISQRVLYYRVVRTNSGGSRLTVGPKQVEVTP